MNLKVSITNKDFEELKSIVQTLLSAKYESKISLLYFSTEDSGKKKILIELSSGSSVPRFPVILEFGKESENQFKVTLYPLCTIRGQFPQTNELHKQYLDKVFQQLKQKQSTTSPNGLKLDELLEIMYGRYMDHIEVLKGQIVEAKKPVDSHKDLEDINFCHHDDVLDKLNDFVLEGKKVEKPTDHASIQQAEIIRNYQNALKKKQQEMPKEQSQNVMDIDDGPYYVEDDDDDDDDDECVGGDDDDDDGGDDDVCIDDDDNDDDDDDDNIDDIDIDDEVVVDIDGDDVVIDDVDDDDNDDNDNSIEKWEVKKQHRKHMKNILISHVHPFIDGSDLLKWRLICKSSRDVIDKSDYMKNYIAKLLYLKKNQDFVCKYVICKGEYKFGSQSSAIKTGAKTTTTTTTTTNTTTTTTTNAKASTSTSTFIDNEKKQKYFSMKEEKKKIIDSYLDQIKGLMENSRMKSYVQCFPVLLKNDTGHYSRINMLSLFCSVPSKSKKYSEIKANMTKKGDIIWVEEESVVCLQSHKKNLSRIRHVVAPPKFVSFDTEHIVSLNDLGEVIIFGGIEKYRFYMSFDVCTVGLTKKFFIALKETGQMYLWKIENVKNGTIIDSNADHTICLDSVLERASFTPSLAKTKNPFFHEIKKFDINQHYFIIYLAEKIVYVKLDLFSKLGALTPEIIGKIDSPGNSTSFMVSPHHMACLNWGHIIDLRTSDLVYDIFGVIALFDQTSMFTAACIDFTYESPILITLVPGNGIIFWDLKKRYLVSCVGMDKYLDLKSVGENNVSAVKRIPAFNSLPTRIEIVDGCTYVLGLGSPVDSTDTYWRAFKVIELSERST